MAIKKPVLTADVKTDQEIKNQPVHQQTTEDLTAPEMLAKVDEPKYVTLKSPTGSVTSVPAEIVDALVDSGYSRK